MLFHALRRHNQLGGRRRRDRQFDQARDNLVAPKHVDPEADQEGDRQPQLDEGNRGERDQALARP
jgi:hypothetical protein